MSIFASDTLCKYLAILEQSIDINSFQVDQIHLWPFLRTVLATNLEMRNDKASYDRYTSDPKWCIVVELIEQKFDSLSLGPVSSSNVSNEENISSSTKNRDGTPLIGFVSRPADHSINTPDGWYAPLIDGWYHLAKQSYRVKKNEFMAGETKDPTSLYPRVYPPSLIFPQFYSQDLTMLQEFKKQSKLLMVAVNEFSYKDLGLNFDGDRYLNQLYEIIRVSLVVRNCMKPVLKEFQYDVVVTGISYYAIGYGVHWAASDVGVLSVELQHGHAADHHKSFTHQTSLPDTGYRVKPKIYNAWGKRTAESILKWFPKNHNYHRVIVGGKVSNKHLTDLFSKEVKLLEEVISSYQKVILVSLDCVHSANSPEIKRIINLVIRSPENWFWLLRQHYLSGTRGFEDGLTGESTNQLFGAQKCRHFEAVLSSALPLDLILPLCDHHVSHLSSVAMEASANGIPTTFIHPLAEMIFKSMSQIGLVSFAYTVDEALYSIEQSSKSNFFLELGKNEVDVRISTHEKFFEKIF